MKPWQKKSVGRVGCVGQGVGEKSKIEKPAHPHPTSPTHPTSTIENNAFGDVVGLVGCVGCPPPEIREIDFDAHPHPTSPTHPTTIAPPGGLIDALAADELLHPRGITTTADGKRTWQHPDFDAVECAKAMRDRTAPASAKWDAKSGRFNTNRDTDRFEAGGGA